MSGSSIPSIALVDNDDVDTKILPRIGGVHKDAEIWKFRITDWFRRERIVTDAGKFSYIIASCEDDIVRVLHMEQVKLNRILTLDECVYLIKKKYWRENLKEDKLRQIKKIMINPNESIYDFNTRFLELYDQLDSADQSSFSVIDYENALRPRSRIYERIAMAEAPDLETACKLAEKYENILTQSQGNQEMWGPYGNINNYNRRNNFSQPGRSNLNNAFIDQYNNNSNFTPFNNNFNTFNNSGNFNRIRRFNNVSLNSSSRMNSSVLRNFRNPNFNSFNNNNNLGNNNFNNNYNNGNNYNNSNNNNRNMNHNTNNYNNNSDVIDDLTNQMKNLKIKTCYFCHQPDHVLKDCVAFDRFQNDPNYENYINSLYSQKN